jgi:hypothetical protein
MIHGTPSLLRCPRTPVRRKLTDPVLCWPAGGLSMRIALVREGAVVPRSGALCALPPRIEHALARSLLAGLCAMSLSGCALDEGNHRPSRVRHEDASGRAASPPRALLKPLPSPSCEESAAEPAANPADPNAELARRIRAEYELVCYRMAEALARQRLRQLQVWIASTPEGPLQRARREE